MSADVPVVEVVAVDAALDALDAPTSSEVYAVTESFSDTAVAAAAAARALAGGGGGSQAVSCLLARDAPFDIRQDAATGEVLWDALYGDIWDLGPLVAIPAGLGLTFAFDGTDGIVATTEAGIWSLSYFARREVDQNWGGSLQLGIGLNIPWIQPRIGTGEAAGVAFLSGSFTVQLPAGTPVSHDVATTNEATSDPYTCTQVYLSIVRIA